MAETEIIETYLRLSHFSWAIDPSTLSYDDLIDANPEETQRLRGLSYRKYLKTPHWRRKKKEAFRHYAKRCAVCGERSRLDVHHIRYDNLGCESIDDLMILCRGCHDVIHKRGM